MIKKYSLNIMIVILSLLADAKISHTQATQNNVVKILMPAPFADSTRNIIKEYNRINKGKLKVN